MKKSDLLLIVNSSYSLGSRPIDLSMIEGFSRLGHGFVSVYFPNASCTILITELLNGSNPAS